MFCRDIGSKCLEKITKFLSSSRVTQLNIRSANPKEWKSKSKNVMYVCPCIIYEIDERYPLDATIYLLL